MTLKPRVSEKSYGLAQNRNVYVFQVPTGASKLLVAKAVESQFAVSVLDVNIANVKGKLMRTVRKGGRQTFGKRPDVKKAYVTLKAGDSIAVFASEEDEKADSNKKEKK
ncbi:MAG TPA: 50S ribosomal protein L23 [Candidatus Saccharimonadales bacterium]|nr:50S ribosomal protein L23 [Candidatus Saccharimonadales bacterium]